MLNRRKGPAMHRPRAQADKKAYQFDDEADRSRSSRTSTLRQEMVEDLLIEDDGDGRASRGVRVRGGDALSRRAPSS